MLNMYRSVFFEILSIYRKFSSDPHIGIFAMSFFSVVISFMIMAILSYLGYFFYEFSWLEEKKTWVFVFGGVQIVHTLFFLLNKNKQEERFEEYQTIRTKGRTIFVFAFVVFVFVSSFWIFTMHRERNLAEKELVEQTVRTNK
ncbi:MAG TPA: hypothetical protein GX009_00390 [Candidatus Atribacteria bacterium]|nr:hypothetical protein [Candidatus Atribacteria bacterium]